MDCLRPRTIARFGRHRPARSTGGGCGGGVATDTGAGAGGEGAAACPVSAGGRPDGAEWNGVGEGSFPVAENAYRRAVSLPMFPGMTDRDVDDVAAAVRKVAAHFRA